MKTFEEIAKEDGRKAQVIVDEQRARRSAVEAIFNMLGRACRTEEQRADVFAKLQGYAESGIITADELESYKSTITVKDARARVAPPKPQPAPDGRVKDVFDAVRGKSRGGAYDLSPEEFKDAWEKI